MGKYRDHEEFGAIAPWKWRVKTTRKKYRDGLLRVAPPGAKIDEKLTENYEKFTKLPESNRYHKHYDRRMFGVSEVVDLTQPELQKSYKEKYPKRYEMWKRIIER